MVNYAAVIATLGWLPSLTADPEEPKQPAVAFFMHWRKSNSTHDRRVLISLLARHAYPRNPRVVHVVHEAGECREGINVIHFREQRASASETSLLLLSRDDHHFASGFAFDRCTAVPCFGGFASNASMTRSNSPIGSFCVL